MPGGKQTRITGAAAPIWSFPFLFFYPPDELHPLAGADALRYSTDMCPAIMLSVERVFKEDPTHKHVERCVRGLEDL